MTRFTIALGALALGAVSTLGGCANSSTSASASTSEAPAEASMVGQRVDGSLTLKNEQGRTVTLASLYEREPVVLTFYRGNWCPYCVRALKEWQGKTDELNRAGGRLVAVSLENLEGVKMINEKVDPSYTVLSDYTGKVSDFFDLTFQLDEGTQKRYAGFGIDLAKSNASGEWELPHPGTYVIDRDGVIRYEYDEPNYQVRADPDEVIGVVSRLN